MGNPTTNCRIYPQDNGWLMEHRKAGSTAELITKLIRHYERTKILLQEVGLE